MNLSDLNKTKYCIYAQLHTVIIYCIVIQHLKICVFAEYCMFI